MGGEGVDGQRGEDCYAVVGEEEAFGVGAAWELGGEGLGEASVVIGYGGGGGGFGAMS